MHLWQDLYNRLVKPQRSDGRQMWAVDAALRSLSTIHHYNT